VGTIETLYRTPEQEVRIPSANTTPESIVLQKLFRDMADSGVQAVVMEVSSQALMLNRTAGFIFDLGIFTNLSADHIGPNEHPSFENYRACKHRLFTDFQAKHVAYNADDTAASDMLQGTCATHLVSCSACKTADYTASDITPFRNEKQLGVSFTLQSREALQSCMLPLTGNMNVYNALLAVATVREVFGMDLIQAVQALSVVTVSGRSELISLPNGACSVIDYAHNGESLAKLLTTLREYMPNRLIVLFGSIGERAQMRRRERGSVAASLSDLAILT
jgi:UDP-N-acetylmuramoyl-L-alanyl-D-glutamate--2,6-diaminopimelate ligase